MKKIFAVVIVTPVLALFAGIGVLAFNIAGSWDTRNTDVLISGVITACGIGGVVVALVLSAFVGLVFYSRWQQERQWSVPPPPKVLPPANQIPSWMHRHRSSLKTRKDTCTQRGQQGMRIYQGMYLESQQS